MPEVPYRPYADVSPIEGSGGHSMSVNTPEAAFGGTVANAITSAGRELEHGGDEMFSRAMAIQALKNETEAKEADAQLMVQAGQLHANYSTLQGRAASDGLDAHIKAMQDLRDQIRAGLSNDMVRKMYDSSSLSTIGRNIFNAAGHAATQTKVYANNASKARVDAMKDEALSNPGDDVAFQASVNKTMAEIDAQGGVGLGGWGEDQIAHQKSEAVSALWSNRIVGLARTSPFKAKDMMEAAFEKHLIRGQDMDAVKKSVYGQVNTVGSRNISDAVNAGFAPYMRQQDVDRFTGVEESLTRIFKQAQQDNPDLKFSISSGRRTQAQQDALYAQGRTAPGPIVTHTRDSNHLTGRAIDVQPLDNNTTMEKIEVAMKAASAKLGIPLGPEHDQIKGWDPGHYSLPREYNVATAPKAVEEPLQRRVDRATAYARSIEGDEDTGLSDATRNRVEGDFTRAKTIKRDFDFTNNNTIANALVGGVDGKIPTTKEELAALGPQVAQAWDQLDATKQLYWLDKLSKQTKDISWTSEGLRRYQTLKAMANDEHGAQDFLNTDVIAEKLPNSAKRELINLQQNRLRVANDDPKVANAMASLGGELDTAGISRTQDKDRYYQFRGALSGALEAFQEANKRPAKDEEVHAIGTRLLQEMHTHWWESSQLRYEVPDDVAEEIKADPKWRELNQEPSPQMIARVYARRQFQKLYGGTTAKKEGSQTK